ncbi:MAG TPA: ankyrin repeat domain-containing protein, partial [Verrucomicrobium sp.]|nr:ankyrin repeat domain-containing protein [Verrucomicrobium sp.]
LEAQRQKGLVQSLYQACDRKDLDTVQALIRQGVDVNGACDTYEGKPFFRAIYEGTFEIVETLLAAGAKANEPDAHGYTALALAAGGGESPHPERTRRMVKLLLDHGAAVQAYNQLAITTAARNSVAAVQQLMAAGGKLSQEALAAAVGASQREVFEFLLTQGLDPKARLKGGKSLIHFLPDEPLLTRLLALGLEINAVDENGQTPLHVAAWRQNEGAVKLLLDHHAFIDARDMSGDTPLMIKGRRFWGSQDLRKLLLSRGADFSIRNFEGRTALDIAVEDRLWDFAQKLFAAGAKTEAPEKLLCYLMITALNEPFSAEALETSVRGVVAQMGTERPLRKVHAPLLVWAVRGNHPALAGFLADAGADLDVADEEGRTALMWAEIAGSDVLRALLKDRGVNAGIRDKLGRTAADWKQWRTTTMSNLSPGESDGSDLSTEKMKLKP